MSSINKQSNSITVFSLIISLILVLGCGSKTEKKDKDLLIMKNKILPNKNFLEGLKPAEKNDFVAMRKRLSSDYSIPIYTEDGQIIEKSEMNNKLIYGGGGFSVWPYVNDQNELKLGLLSWSDKLKDERKKEMKKIFANRDAKSNLIGKDAIPFSVKDINENEYSLKNLREKVIVMNFWFIACHGCVLEIPDLNKLVEKYKGKEVVFLGFANDKKDKLIPFLQKTPFNYIIIPESKAISISYEVKSFPTHVVIDKDSKIKYYKIGSLEPDTYNYSGGLISNALIDLAKEIDLALAN